MDIKLYQIFLPVVCSFALSYYLIPKIIGIAKNKSLMDTPNKRSSHEQATPRLGGVSFYLCLMMSFYFLSPWDQYDILPSLLPGLTILFAVGIKDDLTFVTAKTKFISQILACSFLVIHFKFELYSLNGFFGVGLLNNYIALFLVLFLLLSIINAFNLIDGIDGLAGVLSLVGFGTFAYFFYILQFNLMFGICLVLMGSVGAFLRYNMSHKKKIFMGDTGSMIIGFMMAAMAVRFLAIDFTQLDLLPFSPANLPVIVASIMIVPLYDMSRVVIIRLSEKRSPFAPDRNHLHHVLIDHFSVSHRRSSIYLGLFNLLFIVTIVLLTQILPAKYLFFIFLLFLLIMTFVLRAIQQGKVKGSKTLEEINK